MKVKCIGAGGIGSFFVEHIERLIETKQIQIDMTVYDDDIVELKNILYQNFSSEDIDSYKVEALEGRYFECNYDTNRLGKDDLKDCDLVILCADNNKIRKSTYENYKENNIPFIDARANGKTIGIYTSDTKDYISTLGKSNESSSCQNPFQIDKGEVEYGNVVVAAALAQKLLNYIRKNRMPNNFVINL